MIVHVAVGHRGGRWLLAMCYINGLSSQRTEASCSQRPSLSGMLPARDLNVINSIDGVYRAKPTRATTSDEFPSGSPDYPVEYRNVLRLGSAERSSDHFEQFRNLSGFPIFDLWNLELPRHVPYQEANSARPSGWLPPCCRPPLDHPV